MNIETVTEDVAKLIASREDKEEVLEDTIRYLFFASALKNLGGCDDENINSFTQEVKYNKKLFDGQPLSSNNDKAIKDISKIKLDTYFQRENKGVAIEFKCVTKTTSAKPKRVGLVFNDIFRLSQIDHASVSKFLFYIEGKVMKEYVNENNITCYSKIFEKENEEQEIKIQNILCFCREYISNLKSENQNNSTMYKAATTSIDSTKIQTTTVKTKLIKEIIITKDKKIYKKENLPKNENPFATLYLLEVK